MTPEQKYNKQVSIVLSTILTDDEERAEFARINAFNEAQEDTPDGAFFAMGEEFGIDVDDWVWFSELMSEAEKMSALIT